MEANPQTFDEFIDLVADDRDGLFCSWWFIQQDRNFPGPNGIETVAGKLAFVGVSFDRRTPDLTFEDLVANAGLDVAWNHCIVWSGQSNDTGAFSQEELQEVIRNKLAKMDKKTTPGSEGWSSFAGGMAFDEDGARVEKIVFPQSMRG